MLNQEILTFEISMSNEMYQLFIQLPNFIKKNYILIVFLYLLFIKIVNKFYL